MSFDLDEMVGTLEAGAQAAEKTAREARHRVEYFEGVRDGIRQALDVLAASIREESHA